MTEKEKKIVEDFIELLKKYLPFEITVEIAGKPKEASLFLEFSNHGLGAGYLTNTYYEVVGIHFSPELPIERLKEMIENEV